MKKINNKIKNNPNFFFIIKKKMSSFADEM